MLSSFSSGYVGTHFPPRTTSEWILSISIQIRILISFELTGNDPELDPNRPPAPPAKAVDRPAPRVGKRDAPKEAPSTQPRENAGRRGGRVTGGNDAGMWIYRDYQLQWWRWRNCLHRS